MDAGDIKQAAAKYWPYLAGGAIGLFLLVRYSGGSNSSGGTDLNSALLQQGNTAYAYQAQSNANQLQYDLQQAQINAAAAERADAKELAFATLSAQTAATNQAGMVAYLQAQGTTAQGVGAAAAGVIQALNTPALYAINAASAENSSALESAAYAASAGYAAQASNVAYSADIVKSVAGTLGATSPADVASANNPQPTAFQTAVSGATSLGRAYIGSGKVF